MCPEDISFSLFRFLLILPDKSLECVYKHMTPTKDKEYVSNS